jgi:hypothetical protein
VTVNVVIAELRRRGLARALVAQETDDVGVASRPSARAAISTRARDRQPITPAQLVFVLRDVEAKHGEIAS